MHIARLREKLRDDPDRPAMILTVRGKGYMFAARDGAEVGGRNAEVGRPSTEDDDLS